MRFTGTRPALTTALALTLATVLAACSSADSQTQAAGPTYSAQQYSSAINDIARPATDRESDAVRKPGELLAFAQIDRGERVGDYIMGSGYVTRLLAMAVGSQGKVYAFQPQQFIAFRPEYATEQDEAVAPYPERVVPLRGPIAAPAFPEPLDTIITVNNLHDFFVGAMPPETAQQAIAALYAGLKPGGRLVVVDHQAPDGAGAAAADSLHRMDRQQALDALTQAGFELEEESDLYALADDPRTANVFEEAIRGRTSQFALRLRKPVDRIGTTSPALCARLTVGDDTPTTGETHNEMSAEHAGRPRQWQAVSADAQHRAGLRAEAGEGAGA
jgi:predicted methyltransferase